MSTRLMAIGSVVGGSDICVDYGEDSGAGLTYELTIPGGGDWMEGHYNVDLGEIAPKYDVGTSQVGVGITATFTMLGPPAGHDWPLGEYLLRILSIPGFYWNAVCTPWDIRMWITGAGFPECHVNSGGPATDGPNSRLAGYGIDYGGQDGPAMVGGPIRPGLPVGVGGRQPISGIPSAVPCDPATGECSSSGTMPWIYGGT